MIQRLYYMATKNKTKQKARQEIDHNYQRRIFFLHRNKKFGNSFKKIIDLVEYKGIRNMLFTFES